jgi:peptidoglycan/xylan/chitin deacetylase (PgdA/CDA1 family)
MYHRIARESFDPWGLAVSPERFARQVEWLERHRTILPLEEFARLHERRKLPRSAVALTFDDGYACSLEAAAAILEHAGVSATVFLPAQLIGRSREFWWDELARIVVEFEGTELSLDNGTVTVPAGSAEDHRWAAGDEASTPRQRLYLELWSVLRSRDLDEIDRTLDRIREQGKLHSENRDAYRRLSAEEIRSASSPAVSFGSHAMSHRPLTSLPPEERRREIRESAAACAKLTGTAPKTFAYPFGDCDGETADMVRDAGFTCACTTEPAFVIHRTPPFMIPRLQAGNWEPRQLAKVLRGR